ncbi:MAG: UDP-3-O-[3-hydroxymyristoyl] glucosamine N-acyltransferase [Myxococcota bacterium]|jgi:UDP-3-O-[3-hydroxymyristoyl] glucosamine N-acyltransferase
MHAAELAALVGGVLAGPDGRFETVAPLSGAGPTHVAYAEGAVPSDCAAGVLLVCEPIEGRCCVVAPDPKAAFITLLHHLFPETHPAGVHSGAHVDPSARLGEGVVVYPGAFVGADCEIGAGTIIFPNAVIYPATTIGRRCRIHASAVIGSDGFSYHPTATGILKVPQVGRVVLGDDVEVGAGSTIDRAFLTETRLGDGVKLDNLVHVGHNSQLGRGVIVAAQSGISGSCTIGDFALLGGQVGVADHAEIGAGARLGARSAAHGRLAGGQTYLGVPAAPIRLTRRMMAVSRRLPEMWRTLQSLRRTVDQLTENKSDGDGVTDEPSPEQGHP